MIVPCGQAGCPYTATISGRTLNYTVTEMYGITITRSRNTWTMWRAKDIVESWWAAHWNRNHNEEAWWAA